MSSLAASRADNFYYPPGWEPSKGSISKFQGSKGANQYEQYGIIRFELPFDGWCLNCERHMSKGLRFNAKKDKAGKYFSTQIWEFSMKCYSCPQRFKIRTDPENRTYNFADGIRKHEQDYTPDFDDSVIIADSTEVKAKINADPIFRMEHENEDKRKAQSERERLETLSTLQDKVWKDMYNSNAILRRKNREKKRHIADQVKEGRKRGLNIPVLNLTKSDLCTGNEEEIHGTLFKMREQALNSTENERKRDINNQHICIKHKKKKESKNGKEQKSCAKKTKQICMLNKAVSSEVKFGSIPLRRTKPVNKASTSNESKPSALDMLKGY